MVGGINVKKNPLFIKQFKFAKEIDRKSIYLDII